MLDRLRRWVLGALRVPADPDPPPGSRVLRVFRAAPAFYRYRLTLWALAQVWALVGLIGGLVLAGALASRVDAPLLRSLVLAAEGVAVAAFLAQLPVTYALLRLDFEMRWYILSDRSLRIREGLVSVREKTMTFANLQQIAIRQNPLQRLLGIADVQVRTAGGGSGGRPGDGGPGEGMHEAYFRGVDNAEEIRAAIRERVRLHRDAGLGDPDEPAPSPGAPEPVGTAGALAAARTLLHEMRELRRALAP